MINTILFDLDGTLLPLDNDLFEKEYFKRLCYKFKDTFLPDVLVKYIWDATTQMVLNIEDDKTNKEVFMNRFSELSGMDAQALYCSFIDFYKNEYRDLEGFFKPQDYIMKSVELLKQKGYCLVVATNPLFPIEAVEERIKWAGLEKEDFILVTTFEDMHYCKPQVKYYNEILDKVGKTPTECLMVGNDVEEDLAAKEAGIKTYLIKDHILNKKNIVPVTDFIGTYKEFHEFVLELPDLQTCKDCFFSIRDII